MLVLLFADGAGAATIPVSGGSDSLLDHSDAHNPFEIAGDNFSLTKIGHLGGLTYGIAVSGNYVYFGQGGDFVVLDNSNVSAPVEVSRMETNGVIYDIEVAGNYAYIADLDNGLVIIDVSNPNSPVLISNYDTAGEALEVAVAGNYAYVTNGYSGLVILDVSDPASPALIGIYDTPGYSYGVAIAGNYAYVADNSNGLVILNVSNPAAPTLIGGYGTGGNTVAVIGNYAYTAKGSILEILDVSNPASPTLIGSYDTSNSILGITVAEDYAYVADYVGGLVIVDVSNPAAPTLIGSYDTAGWPYRVAVAGNYAYVADMWNGLVILDVSDLASPTLIGSYGTIGQSLGVAVAGNYAYVLDGGKGLVILDVSNPTSPTLISSYYSGSYSEGLEVAGNYAYIPDGEGGLVILDVGNPAAPTLEGSYDTAGVSNAVAVAGNYAYVADRDNGLVIIDVSNPESPSLIGSYDTAMDSRGIAIAGNYAYVADGYDGLLIVNVSNPTAPALIGSYDTPFHAFGVAVAGNYAYVADGYSGLVIVNVSNPSAPTLIGSYDTPGYAFGVAVAGNYAYVADSEGGLVILDVINPAAPALKGSYDTPNSAYGVAVAGNYVYVGDFENGLMIFRINGTSSEVDLTPPASVSNLQNVSYAQNHINWTWTDPADIDFDHVEVYLDGIQKPNVSAGVRYYNATGLTASTTHEISTRTVDNSGNINETWKNHTATTSPPMTLFTEISTNIIGSNGVSWGDYDNDGDLDVLLSGGYAASHGPSKVYRNDGGEFIDINAGLPSDIAYGFGMWADYDNDGDLDILLTAIGFPYSSKIYRNDNGNFIDINAGIIGVYMGSADFGDYDNDGDLDLFIQGMHYDGSYVNVARMYRNDNGNFIDINTNINGGRRGSVAWGDYDNDSDLDIFVNAGEYPGSPTRIYRNDNGIFTDINAGLPSGWDGSVDWGDYDNDGDLDILFSYASSVRIYQNNVGTFTLASILSDKGRYSSAEWGDYDNDGDLDVAVTGTNNSLYYSPPKVFRNDGGLFVEELNTGLPVMYHGGGTNPINALSWGDYDNDGDLDLLITGQTSPSGMETKLFRNNMIVDVVDTSAPASVTGLTNNSYAQTSINWTWIEPIDSDFSKVMIYLNGTFQTNVTNGTQYYNATGLTLNTSYQISTHTVDTSGNINQTWKNHTAKTASGSVHNINKGIDYLNIQSSIDDATPGDEIHVDSGTYYENVNLTKQLILRGIGMPVVDAMGNGSAITLAADGIILEGFTATGAGSNQEGGIKVISSGNMLIGNNASNDITYSWPYVYSHGIYLVSSCNNILIGNNASYNYDGIFLNSSSNNNTLQGNNASNNDVYGIYLSSSSNNTLIGNNANLNQWTGIGLMFSSNNNTLIGNNANSNNIHDGWGIYIYFSSNNTLSSNSISNNRIMGIYFVSSLNNKVYNNIFNNFNNFYFTDSNINTWNSTKESGTNIIGGLYLGGNLWATPSGSGFSQTCPDADGDGICDSPYFLDANNIDYLPLLMNFTSYTPIGANVQVVPHPNVSVEFSGVSEAGNTSVIISTTNPGSEIPGYMFLGTFYDIVTTATYDGEIIIIIEPDPGGIDIPIVDVVLEHWNGMAWEDVPISVDITNNTISGTVSSLSPFGLAIPLPVTRYIYGTVKDNSTGNNLTGVTVSVNSTLSTTTNATGFYSFEVTEGTYNITATHDITYYTNITAVSTIGKAEAEHDIEMLKKPTGNITGSVTKV